MNAPPSRNNTAPLRVAVYSLELERYACAQLRVVQPALKAGAQLEWAAQSDGVNYAIHADSLERCDLALVQRTFPQAETWTLIEKILTSGKPVVYECDDLLLAVPDAHPLKARLDACVPYVRELLAHADLVTVSTPALAAAYAAYARRIEVLPNGLPDRFWRWKPPLEPAPGKPVRIGFAGTASHIPDLELIEPALVDIAAKYGTTVEFLFYGCATQRLRRLPQAVWRPFGDDYAGYCRALPRLGLHIGLAPLVDNPFNRCKSDIKWQEYAACGAAGVYSDLEPYRDAVRSGTAGLLAPNDPAVWFEKLDDLISNPALCKQIAHASQTAAKAATLASRAAGYAQVWESLARNARNA